MSQSLDLARHGLAQAPTRPEIPGGPRDVASVLDRALAQHPERVALVGRSGRRTYAQLDHDVDRRAAALIQLGVSSGDRVAATLPNDLEIVTLFLAVQRLGALWVGVNAPLAAAEKAYILSDCEASVFIGTAQSIEQINEAHAVPTSLKHTLSAEDPGEWTALVSAISVASRPRAEIDPFAPAAIAYTSGTTGFPKGAVHSQHNLQLPGAVARGTSAYPLGQSHGVLLPLTVLNLMVLVPLLAWQIDGCCVCMDRVDPEGIAEWVRIEKIGHFAAVPTIYHDLLTHPSIDPADLSSLVRPEVGGAECPKEFLELYRSRFGSDVSIGYGMTEAPTAVTRSSGDSPPTPGLCGKALAHLDISIRDEDGEVLATGEIGEICVRAVEEGEWKGVYTPMLGYWNKPEETSRALREAIYYTGDLGLLDENGDLYIRGRRGDLILRGGANVYPAEIERVLHADDRVVACAVFGVKDERLGERVAAAVHLAPGIGIDEEELKALCRTQLARYKVPDRFYFVDAIPRNAMGKVVKHRLKASLNVV